MVGSRTEEGAVATGEKRSASTPLVLFACLSVLSVLSPQQQHQAVLFWKRHDHACQRQPSRATINPNHDRHPPSRNPRPGAIPPEDRNRPTSRALQSLHHTAIVEQDTSQLKRLSRPPKK